MTIEVEVGNGIITQTAPIAQIFVGQPFSHLINWMKKSGGFRMKELP